MKKHVYILALLLLAACLLTACGGGGLSGKYVNANDGYECIVFADGKATYEYAGEGVSVIHERKGDRLTITLPFLGDTEFTLSKDGNEFYNDAYYLRFVKEGAKTQGKDEQPGKGQTGGGQEGRSPINETLENMLKRYESDKSGQNEDSGGGLQPGGQPTEDNPWLDGLKLNLPLVIKNKTVAKVDDNSFLYVKNDNTAWLHQDYGNPTESHVMDNVRSVDFFGNNYSGHTYVFITNNNELWAYGNNKLGQLGDNTGVDKDEPVKIFEDVANVYGAVRHVDGGGGCSVYALKTDGTLWVWGVNTFGALSEDKNIYAPMKFMDDVVDVKVNAPVASYNSQVNVITSDGSLWAWSDVNALNEIEVSGQPMRIMSNVVDVVEGSSSYEVYEYHILKGDASLWNLNINKAKRYDTYITTVNSFEKVMDDVQSVSYQNGSIYAITKDNTLYAWGKNDIGQLGDGTKIDRKEPVKISGDVKESIYTIPTRLAHMFMLKTDGTLLHWTDEDLTPAVTAKGVAGLYERTGLYQKTDGSIIEYNTLYREHGEDEWGTIVTGVKMPSETAR